MPTLARNDLKEFLDSNINSSNFHIFSKLLFLQDNTLYTRLLEMLFDYKISLFDLVSLEEITDDSISEFFRIYDNKYLNIQQFYSTTSTFNPVLYLSTNNYIDNMIALNNQYRNLNIKSVQVTDYIVNMDLKVNSYNTFSSELELINAFNTEILPLVLAEYNVVTISDIFGGVNAMPYIHTDINNKYDNVFASIHSTLTDSELYKLCINIKGVSSSLLDLLPESMFNILNFDIRDNNALDMKHYYLSYLSQKDEGFDSTDHSELITKMLNEEFTLDYSLHYNYVLFIFYLTSIYNIENTLPVDTLYLTELEDLGNKITLLKQLISFVRLKINEKFGV